MLLAIDISNTNIKFGLYQVETMKHHWVVSTVQQRTSDEYAMVLSNLLSHVGHALVDIDDIIMSCVVPSLTPVFQDLALRYCRKKAFVINHSLDLGIRLLVDNPWEVGVDRIMTILAAHCLYGGPAIVLPSAQQLLLMFYQHREDFWEGQLRQGWSFRRRHLAVRLHSCSE